MNQLPYISSGKTIVETLKKALKILGRLIDTTKIKLAMLNYSTLTIIYISSYLWKYTVNEKVLIY